MDNRNSRLNGHLAEGISDSGGDQVGMSRLSLKDDPDADDGIRFGLCYYAARQIGDLEGSGCVDKLDRGSGLDEGDFLDGLVHHGVNEIRIVTACHDNITTARL